VKEVDPTTSVANFNERFQMKTALEYDESTNKFLQKKVVDISIKYSILIFSYLVGPCSIYKKGQIIDR
jgi:hypothetical protein